MFANFLQRRRQKHARAAEERKQAEQIFGEFLAQTQALVPQAPKHPEAALYRHAWKRAVVLQIICQRLPDAERAETYQAMVDLAAERYRAVAPQDAYGPVRLRMTPKAAQRLLQEEVQRLLSQEQEEQPRRPLACIYLGTDTEGLPYIGQTVDPPERRWKEHRLAATGPFKKGAPYVQWRVIHGPVAANQLNELESYYIGLFDACEKGYNDSRGNDWQAYARGCADRVKGRPRP